MKKSRNSRIIYNGLRMLSRYKLRTFFMMLGVIIGITALTVALTIGNGVEKKVIENVQRFIMPNNIIVTADQVSAEGLRESEAGPNSSLKIEDADAIARQLDGIVDYDYSFMMNQVEVSYMGVNHFTNISGCRTQGEIIWNKPAITGRFFNEAELKGSKRVAVLAPKLAKILFGDEDPIGKQFQLANAPFTVIGVSEYQGADPHGSDLDDELYIPITTLMRRVANVDYIMAAKFVFENEQQSIAAESVVREILRERHSLTEGESDDFTMLTPVLVKEIIAEIVKVFKVLLPAISAIALFAGAIVIMVLMNMSVNQRIKEVGLRKALGAKNKDISTQFIAESIAVVLLGGIVGLVLGLVLSKLISEQMNASFYIPIQTIVVGISLSVLTGFISGIAPARKAAQLNPVETLK